MLVYNPDGVEFDKEPCDVRECVAQGWTREAPKVAQVEVKVEAPKEVVIEQPAATDEAPKRGRPKMFGGNEVI